MRQFARMCKIMDIVFRPSNAVFVLGTVVTIGFITITYHFPVERMHVTGPPKLKSVLPDTSLPTAQQLAHHEDDTLSDKRLSELFMRALPCMNNSRCRPKSHTKVVIVTYKRSGSTFTGDILSAHPEVFYVFEPLHSIGKTHNILFTYLRDRRKRVKFSKPSLMRRSTDAVLDCNFEKLDLGTLLQFHMKNSRSTKSYYECLSKHPGVFGLLHCLPDLYVSCYSASVVLTKTIILSMEAASKLVTSDPEVKVIHLIRDPRASISSEGRYGVYNRNKYAQFERYTDKFCNRLQTDLKSLVDLKNSHPDRATILLYENLAEAPLEVSKVLYNFVNLTMLTSVSEHVINITRGKQESCPLCVSRADSAKTSQEWRKSLSFKRARYIETACAKVFKLLGYKSAGDEQQYLNTSYLLHTKPWQHLRIY